MPLGKSSQPLGTESGGKEVLLLVLGGAGNSTAPSVLHKPLVAEAALLNVLATKINPALLASTPRTKLDFLDLCSTT